jgi:ABC-type sugar transport system ATPase subunit
VSYVSSEVLATRGLVKEFPGVVALKGVDFDLRYAEIHALVGQNGAGKSTFVKVLAGVYTPTRGEIYFKGRKVSIKSVRDAKRLGITLVHQEATLAPNLSIAENVALGILGKEGKVLTPLRARELIEIARKYLEMVGLNIDPRTKVENLGVGERQLVQVARALAEDAEVICLDEPTSPLTAVESERLFNVMRELKARGKSMIFVTHRVEEVFAIADRVTVLRDGYKVFSSEVGKTDPSEVVKYMLGRELEQFYPPKGTTKVVDRARSRLRVVGLTTAPEGRGTALRDVSLEVYPGEVLGVVGLLGSGKTELGKALIGMNRVVKGEVYLDGVRVRIRSPADALKLGVFYIPEDRRREGLVGVMSIAENVVLPKVRELSVLGLVRLPSREVSAARKWIEFLRIVPPRPSFKVMYLSGGNQQKVVIAKALEARTRVLIFDEPTFGIDVGAKVEIRRLIKSLAEEGYSVILLTSDVDEALALSDRIAVLVGGRIVGVFQASEVSRDLLVELLGGRGRGPQATHPA